MSHSQSGECSADCDVEDNEGVAKADAPTQAVIQRWIEEAAHYLPSQGPISVFVHHNTLHAFEKSPFERAVVDAYAMFGCEPYLAESHYRQELTRGRILADDLSWALLETLGDEADRLISFMGTRHHLRLAMLEHPLRLGGDAELRWVIAETDALHRFRPETPAETRQKLLDGTRRWVLRDYVDGRDRSAKTGRDVVESLLEAREFRVSGIERWSSTNWDTFTLTLLWRICHNGVHGVSSTGKSTAAPSPVRHSEFLLAASGVDVDLTVNEILIRFNSAFVDQGFAAWTLPGRDGGYYQAFLDLYQDSSPVADSLKRLPGELHRLDAAGISPLASIAESLDLLGVDPTEGPEYIRRTLLALRGWAGIIHQLETNAEWAARPAASGTLVEYLAVRLILERLVVEWNAADFLGETIPLPELRRVLDRRRPHEPRVSVERRAYLVFQLAQVRGWAPRELALLSKSDWSRLVTEIESFDDLERRRVYQLAYERHYHVQALGALLRHHPSPRSIGLALDEPPPRFQVACCLDEREESFRRHLEEVAPTCETFGIAGFFGVAIYYRGVAEAQFRPLCPVNLKPQIYIREEPLRSLTGASRVQETLRRLLGKLAHKVHMGSRTFIGGVLTGMTGAVATLPLLARVLRPRSTARMRRIWNRIITPQLTSLRLERRRPEPGPDDGGLGFTVPEMAGIVASGLRSVGLTDSARLARLFVVVGHGSSSLNNPQKAAYDCGACGGSQGGPNARAFAQMANDPRVRAVLDREGLHISDDVVFLGAIHNTCDDSVTYFDLDDLPNSHEELFNEVRAAIDQARKRNAHERCRRFESAPLSQTFEEAIHHVEGRAADLSQTRPECGHATNALCVVGRRRRTRGLYMDRRAFLTSYDAARDDEAGTILAGLLRAVFPVCGGISLEYYFSRVDPAGYGCGTKLPHNITSLVGVMDGPSSDLRPGLPWQMVELHEPFRILIVVETTPEKLLRVIEADAMLSRMAHNGWVGLATLDPDSALVHRFQGGRFERYDGPIPELPQAASSLDWYRGWRDHLGFASLVPASIPAPDSTAASSAPMVLEPRS